ncbi:MAG: DNA-3-methyladenine glycosylase 2 family protein [Acidobacteria bacterium]|nr:DNA-3-methyladenine glycosylase 2 family protein [Acidobacteriota bacterium]
MPVPSRDLISAQIVRSDRAFDEVVRLAGPPPARRTAPVNKRFADLVEAIVSQLLATAAADTIHARVVHVCGGSVDEEAILRTGADSLKSAGLSRTKATAIVELAQFIKDGHIKVDRHGRMSDQQILRELTVVRGIGPWTVQMYLMHTLARRDVWPTGDYGVRAGWSVLHGLDETISEGGLREQGDRFVGMRSDVAWYCWQALHFARGAK